MPKLVISLAFFENSSDVKPQRVANIGFVKDNKSGATNVRLALKESDRLIFNKELPASKRIVENVIENGRELLYAPDKLLGWFLSLLKRNMANVFVALLDMLLHSRENNAGDFSQRQRGGQDARS